MVDWSQITIQNTTVGNLKFEIKRIETEYAVIPRVKFHIEVLKNNFSDDHRNIEVRVHNIVGSVNMKKDAGPYLLTNLKMKSPQIKVNPEQRFDLFCELTHQHLNEIEKFRMASDFKFVLQFTFLYSIYDGVDYKWTDTSSPVEIDMKIAKSDWVDNFLSQYKFKDMVLIEFPRLLSTKFEKSIDHLNQAWKLFMSGHYHESMANCRKVLEEIKTEIDPSFISENKIDFKLIVQSGNQDLSTIYSNIYNFTNPGAVHPGNPRSREESHLTIMVVSGLLNLILRNVKGNEE